MGVVDIVRCEIYEGLADVFSNLSCPQLFVAIHEFRLGARRHL